MDMKSEREGLKDLRTIKKDIEEIKVRTADYPRSFLSGILYGAGWVIGSLAALALLGWLLSILGLVPGLSTLVSYIRDLVEQFNAGRL